MDKRLNIYVSDSPVVKFTAVLTYLPCSNNTLLKKGGSMRDCADTCLNMTSSCQGFLYELSGKNCNLQKHQCVGEQKTHNQIFYLKNPLDEEMLQRQHMREEHDMEI